MLPPETDFPSWILVQARDLSPRRFKRLIQSMQLDQGPPPDEDLAYMIRASSELSPAALRFLYVRWRYWS